MKNEVVDKLYKLYYSEAKLYAFSLCHNFELAEEIVSHSFFKAIMSLNEEKDGFKFWLFKVCRNSYFDHLRRNKKQCELNENSATTACELADELIEREEYAALYHAIDLLPEIYREVVRLHYFDGLKISEIANLTEQTEDNVKVLLFRARGKLKTMLEASL